MTGSSDAQIPVDYSHYLDGVGISPRAGWYVSAVLYGTGGSLFLTLMALDLFPGEFAFIAVAALVFGALCLVGVRAIPEAAWAAHARIMIGLSILGLAGFLAGDFHSATNLIQIFPVLAPIVMYRFRVALPYLLAGTAANAVSLAMTADPTAHVLITEIVIIAIGLALAASRGELRRIAHINNRLSTVDPLTGVANVRRMRELLREAIAIESHVSARPALFGMDLDDFKQVNDRFSHTLGDFVLQEVANELQRELVATDVLARRGGDEFMVLVKDTNGRDLEAMRAAMSDAIKRARMATCPEVNPRGSVAYVVHEHGESIEQLLARCDAELHEAKLFAHPERRAHEPNDTVLNEDDYRRIAHEHRGLRGRTERLVRDWRGERDDDQRMARSIKHALSNAATWQLVSVLSITAALALAIASLTTTGDELTKTLPLIGIGGMLMLAALAAYASRNGTREWPLHFALIAMIGCIAVVEFGVSATRASIADLLLLPVVCAFYGLRGRVALPYLLLSLGVFDAAIVSASYEFTTARITTTGLTLIVSVALLAKARRLAHEFTSQAVELSTVDALTGASNLRGMRRAVADGVERSATTGQTVALIAVDLDDFKAVNDRHSHSIGDRVLVAVTTVMNDVTRNFDTVARRGGDEFAIICLLDDELDLIPLISRLAARICEVREDLVPDVTPTASIGSVFLATGETADEFLERADHELHSVKNESRRRRGYGDITLRSV